jgi:RimJ/RimL family protein N-acetyltransferase
MCATFKQPRFETERLVLRPPRPDDAVYIADKINDYDITRMLTRVPYPYGVEDAEEFIEQTAGGDPRRNQVFLAEHRAHGLAGIIGFHEQPTTWSRTGCALSPELGYWFARSFWGNGLATEAVVAALEWVVRDWGVRAVAAGHFADNPASARVLVKAGFLYTGEVQHRFSVARGEPAQTRMMVWLA